MHHQASAIATEGADVPLTVVVPVRNEGALMGAWWEAASPHLPSGTRVLVVYDTDDDDTLPVVRRLHGEGCPVRPLKSRGSGFPDAMLTGLRSVSHGPVLVTMADLSDGLEALPAMLDAYAHGAEIVVGSRYMPGGRQQGAHPVKAFLARSGSLLLHRLVAFPVHDATNAFRLYDARLTARLPVRPAVGFEVVLSLLVDAWREGARIVEIPVVWRGRRHGKSGFRFRWVPRYARIWMRAIIHGLAAPRGARGGAVGRE